MENINRNAILQYTPLSFPQQGLWLTDQLEPGNAHSNIALEITLRGSLDARLLERCINEIVKRHEVLRTTFTQHGEVIAQTIASSRPISLPLVDLAGYNPTLREQELRRSIVEGSGTGFELQRGPLLRATLFRLSGREHVLLLVVHHIVFDGWSMGIFNRELEALYAAYGRRQPSPLPDLPVQYADYAAWQRQWLQGNEPGKLIAYWRGKLAGAPRLELPSDRPKPDRPDYRIDRQELPLPPELSTALKQLAARENCTLFMLLVATFKLLLHRCSGQEDIVVGAPIAGRRGHDEFKGLIGIIINTIVLRTDLSGDPPFCELLNRERQVALGAYQHSALPFDKLVEELRPERKAGFIPFVDVLINFWDESWYSLKLDGLDTSRVKKVGQQSNSALSLDIADCADGISLALQYQSAIFSAGRVRNLLAHLQILLEGVVTNPQARLSELPLLAAAERRQLLVEWNDTARDYPRDLCVHQLFEAQVAMTPDAVAVVQEGQQLTYAELNVRANRLAHYLRGLGIAEEMLVAICVERSLEMVVGLLGVLKAGAAYVPLDPEYPAERLAFMLADSGATVVLTQERLRERLPQNEAGRVCLDADWPQIMQQPGHAPVNALAPRNLVYVIYTSGSTGVPKGVAIEHRSLAAHCHAISEYYQLSANDRVFQFASLSFDASVNQILPALCAGAAVILGKHQLRDPAELDASIRKHGVTVMGLPPTFFQLWIRLYGASNPPPQTLRMIIQGGDVVSREEVMAWRALPDSSARLVNSYGPTEATICSTQYTIPDTPGSGSIPIGRPLNNTRVYVLDRHLQPVPVGVTGELHIGGVRVARGYLNRPELTAEKFIADPFSDEPGARLYKTGDFVRYLADGNVEFLGRMDQQVKIQGFRIELGEIEAALLQHPAVLNTVVQARNADSGGKMLVAFIVKQQDASLTLQELRDFMGQHLPAHLVPGRVFMVNALPLDANGKVDRAALQKVSLPRNEKPATQRTPYNALQATLLQIWSGLLGVAEIGINDNFFELGGDSYGAVTMLHRVEKLTNWSVPLSTIYNNPTVESLAQAMLEHKGEYHRSPLVEIQAGTSGPPFFFMHGDFHGGGYYCHQLVQFMGPDQTFYAIQPHGLPGRPLPSAIEEMADEYLALIRAAFPHGPYFLGGHCNGAMVAFEVAQRLLEEGSQVGLLVMMDPSPVHKQASSVTAVADSSAPHLPDKEMANIDLDKMTPVARHNAVMQLYGGICKRYVPKFYRGKLTLFLTESFSKASDPTQGWKSMSDTGEIHVVPGNHVSMLTVHAPAIAKKLVECRGKVKWD